jgi:glycosyltransferase involved in cell wall biosynthesis
MKIAWIVPGFSSDERDWCIPALHDLARVMATRHEVHIFALHYPYRRERYSVLGAIVHALGGANRRRGSLPRTWNAAWREMTREHRRARFDVLHAFWAYEPGVIAAGLKRRLGVRLILSLAGGELVHLPELKYGYAGRWWLARLMRWAMRQADVVTAGSQAMLSRARDWRGAQNAAAEACVFAPLGVDAEMFSPAGREPPRPAPHTILSVGSLQPIKAQADAIRAFRFVADRHPAMRLSVVGDGPLRADLEALARELNLADRVNLAGEVRHERLPDVYREATLFVQTSLHEAQGMAVLEAAACGLPIVGTPVGALADLAPDAAVTAPPRDPIRLAQTILSLLDDPARRRALGEAARARVESEYSLDRAVERFEALYG